MKLLTKEKLELEQKAAIENLEPLKTESFQLKYQKPTCKKSVWFRNYGHQSYVVETGSVLVDPHQPAIRDRYRLKD